MENMQLQGSHATSSVITPQRDSGAVHVARPETAALRFDDILAKSQSTPAVKESGKAAAEQMWRARPEGGRERRKSEKLEEYREGVDQQSAARLEDRAGVKARQTLHLESAGRSTAVERNQVQDREFVGTKGQWEPVEDSSVNPQQPVQMEPEASSKMNAGASEASDQKRLTAASSQAPADSPSLNTSPTRQPGPVSSSSAAAIPEAAPLAREIARVLVMNSGMHVEQEASPASPAGGVNRSPQAAVASERATSAAKEQPSEMRPSSSQTRSQETSEVSDFEKLVRLVRTSSGKQSAARVLLDPPELGKVHVRVMVEGDRVEIGIETENEAARQMIEERAANLKAVLEENGFLMDRFQVTVNQDGLFDSPWAARRDLEAGKSHPPREDRETNTRSRRAETPGNVDGRLLMDAGTTKSHRFDFEV